MEWGHKPFCFSHLFGGGGGAEKYLVTRGGGVKILVAQMKMYPHPLPQPDNDSSLTALSKIFYLYRADY